MALHSGLTLSSYIQATTHCQAALYVSKAFQTGRGLSRTDEISTKWARTYLNTAVRLPPHFFWGFFVGRGWGL